jgi:hypothetical protein
MNEVSAFECLFSGSKPLLIFIYCFPYMCERVNANNSYVKFCELLLKLHLQMLLYKLLDWRARSLPREKSG